MGLDSADQGGNLEAYYSVRGSTFIFDTTPPTSGIGNFVHLATMSALATITGTTSDGPGDVDPTKVSAGTQRVDVTIQRWSNGQYLQQGGGWGGAGATAWLSASTQVVTATSGTWSLVTAPPWVHGERYWIVARSSDQAGNLQGAYTLGIDRVVTFHLLGATSSITNFYLTAGTSYYNVYTMSITGLAYDWPAGVLRLQVAISSDAGNDADAAWWNGQQFHGDAGRGGDSADYV